MSAPDEMNAWSPAAKSIQQGTCASSSHEHYQVPVRRNDGTTAVREVVLEGRIGAGRTGSPSPGGKQRKQPIHNTKENKGNTSQRAAEAASRIANPAAGTQVPKSVEERPAEARHQGSRSQGIPPASCRKRVPPHRFASTTRVSACEWKRVWAWCVQETAAARIASRDRRRRGRHRCEGLMALQTTGE